MTSDNNSNFDDELDAYEDAMESLHETAARQTTECDELAAAMDTLHESLTEMHDAVDEYGQARESLDDAVISLQQTASARSAGTGRDSAGAD